MTRISANNTKLLVLCLYDSPFFKSSLREEKRKMKVKEIHKRYRYFCKVYSANLVDKILETI